MSKQALTLVGIIAAIGVALGIVGLLRADSAVAQETGPTRSFSPASVLAGGQVNVAIDGIGLATGFGELTETLPAGFAYVTDSATVSGVPRATVEASVDGQDVTFTMVGADAIGYQVDVADDVAAASHTFSGSLMTLVGSQPVGGAGSVTVEAGAEASPDPSPSPSPSPLAQPST